MTLLMDDKMIHKLGQGNLVYDTLSMREYFVTPKLMMLVSENLDEVKHNFLNKIRETMKDNFEATINDQLFDTRVS